MSTILASTYIAPLVNYCRLKCRAVLATKVHPIFVENPARLKPLSPKTRVLIVDLQDFLTFLPGKFSHYCRSQSGHLGSTDRQPTSKEILCTRKIFGHRRMCVACTTQYKSHHSHEMLECELYADDSAKHPTARPNEKDKSVKNARRRQYSPERRHLSTFPSKMSPLRMYFDCNVEPCKKMKAKMPCQHVAMVSVPLAACSPS